MADLHSRTFAAGTAWGLSSGMAAISPPTEIPFDPRTRARALYWCGWEIKDIAEEIDIPRTTVQSWKDRGKWDEGSPRLKAAECTFVRYMQIVSKAVYTPSDRADIDLLGRQIEKFERIRRSQEPDGHAGDLNPNIENRNKGPKKKPRQNLIDDAAADKLRDAFTDGLFDYQLNWKNSTAFTTRMILKSRQIGATYYFAREAVIRALDTGNNQLFISASRAQANIFRNYIVKFVREITGIELKGDPIVIDRGDKDDGTPRPNIELHFLGTNYKTAQGRNGDVYIDECFWIHGFDEIETVASAMASQKFYRVTLFSTPSSISHPAYRMWSGQQYNDGRPRDEQVKVDISHETLKDGTECADGIWRQIVTIFDAEAGGCDLFDIARLQRRYSVDQFSKLFGCQFIDDAQSSFPLSMLRRCMVDSWEVWKDYRPFALCPYDGEVWIGYDPNDNEGEGDPAGLVVLAAPKDSRSKFRVLEKHRVIGLDFQQQADLIRDLKDKYNVTEIAIDGRGCGSAVWQIVKTFHPTAIKIDYSPSRKGLMVLKAQNVIRNGRLEFDSGHTDLAAALMSIHPETTAGGKFTTYVSRRTAELGHGDIGWALLNILSVEPLEAVDGDLQQKSTLVFQDD
ncbi:MAG: terminase family protein [Asticcacaulis sp.]